MRPFVNIMVGMYILLWGQMNMAETIKIGYWIHKPHHYLDQSGQLRGASFIYFEAVAAKMGYTVEWVGPLPFLRLCNYMKDGVLDGMAHNTAQSGLDAFVYSGQPYHHARAIFVVRQDNPLTQITSIQDVAGYRVGWLAEVSPSPFVSANVSQLRMDYLPPGDTMWEQSLTKLLDKRIDAIHELNAFTLPFIAAQMHIADQIKVLRLSDPPTPVYVSFSKQSPKGQVLIERYRAVQAALPFGDEEYEKLMQQEFETLINP